MLYHLYELKLLFSPLNLFQYITFRSAGAFLTGLAVALWMGPGIIRWLKDRKAQGLRADTPATHQAKSGTPAMGGLIIFLAFSISCLAWARIENRLVVLFLSVCAGLAALGFVDDYLKTIGKRKNGLSMTVKLVAQLALALGVAAYLYMDPPNPVFGTHVSVPFSKDWVINLGYAYIPFVIVLLVGSSNAVNLADGLDGLAGGTLVISAMTYLVFAYLAGHLKFSQYLRIIPVAGAGELAVLLAALIGACLGFLWYNAHPAEVFMGDTGSLFLGGALGMAALCVKQELLLIVVGGIFVAEAVSVLLQVYSFRVHNKRIFRMAPLHHHFELSGWAESKVVIRFWIIAIVLSLLALSSLKLR